MWTMIEEPVSSFGVQKMKSQVVDPVPMSIAVSMITAVATTTTTTAAAGKITATAVAASQFLNFFINLSLFCASIKLIVTLKYDTC
jgi:hypothetical protein